MSCKIFKNSQLCIERKFHQETLKLSFHALNYQSEIAISNLMAFQCVRNGPIYIWSLMAMFPCLSSHFLKDASTNQIYL
jgi:hypothetical protein